MVMAVLSWLELGAPGDGVVYTTDAANLLHNHARGRPRRDGVNGLLRLLSARLGGHRLVARWHDRGQPEAKLAGLLSRAWHGVAEQVFLASGRTPRPRRLFTTGSTEESLGASLPVPRGS